MWQINEVLLFDGNLYRILAIRPEDIVWIRLDDEKAQPELTHELTLISYLDEERLYRQKDPFEHIHMEEPQIGSTAFNKREKGLAIIQPIILDEQCFDPTIRAERVEQVRKSGIASIATIYSHLRRYWQRGQRPNALLPDYKNSGAKGISRANSGETKVGRERQYGHGTGMKVTSEIEHLFRRTIEKHLLNKNPLKITETYRRFIDRFVEYYPNVEAENYPTLRQFKYFYYSKYKQEQVVTAQTQLGIYKKDVRPLVSTATANVLGPASRYEIDASIADIYLVDDDDRSKIIGRPTIYVVVDVFSRMITGFYIGFDNPSYVVAMQAFVTACIDKSDICAQFDIELNQEDWPCVGLPDIVLADRGELMSYQVDALISSFNVRVENAPPRRGDAKGIVERCFRTLQSEFKPYTPGVVSGTRVKKSGERDYRLDAVVTIKDFTQIMLRTILYRNNYHVLEKYDRDPDLPHDLPSIPRALWNWGMQHRAGALRKVDPTQLKIALLPRRKVTLSNFGVKMWGIFYSSSEILREGWLHRSAKINRPDHLEAAYDPNSADTIYLFPQPGSRTYWVCSLTDKSRQFRGLTFWQVWEILKQEKHTKANVKVEGDIKRRELDAFIASKITASTKQSPKKIESNQSRIRQIKTNKKAARDAERQNRAKSVVIDETKPIATVIPLSKEEEDYSYPNFVPELFYSTEGENE